jgi:hypothetical protein
MTDSTGTKGYTFDNANRLTQITTKAIAEAKQLLCPAMPADDNLVKPVLPDPDTVKSARRLTHKWKWPKIEIPGPLMGFDLIPKSWYDWKLTLPGPPPEA